MIIVEMMPLPLNTEIICFPHFKEYIFTQIGSANCKILDGSAFVRLIPIVSLFSPPDFTTHHLGTKYFGVIYTKVM